MTKTAQDRLTDTTDYLQTALSVTHANEIRQMLQTLGPVARTALSEAMSLGHSFGSDTAARRAKRALILLSHLFISDVGRRNIELARIKLLSDGSEQPILAELRSWFTLPGVSLAAIAQNAVANIDRMPNWNNQNFFAQDATRGSYNKAKTFNCYSAIVFWAFQAGAISRRYLYRFYEGKDGNAFFPIYSAPGWTDVLTFAPGSAAPTVDVNGGGDIVLPVGRTVYFETPTKVFGHVGLSLGDGRIISQNSVLAPPQVLANLTGVAKIEWEKMTRAVTHIVSIRDMITHYFNGANGYKNLKVSNAEFWNGIPAAQL